MLASLAKLTTPWWKPIAAFFGGLAAYAFPDVATQDAVLGALALVAFDLLTGMAVAIKDGKFEGSTGIRRTAYKTLSYLSLIAVCAVVTRNVSGLDQYHTVSVGGVLTLIILTESVSIVENARKLGARIPFGIEEALRSRFQENSGGPNQGKEPGE